MRESYIEINYIEIIDIIVNYISQPHVYMYINIVNSFVSLNISYDLKNFHKKLYF